MPPVDTSIRPFAPGTTGWSASDLDDPEIEALWFQGRYEIINGVLTTMAPAYFTGNRRLFRLLVLCANHVADRKLGGDFATDSDIIIDDARVVVADAHYLSKDDNRRQEQAFKKSGRRDPERTRILVPPTLIIESVSLGHEQHDRRTKMLWYAEFGVPNYWILDAFKRSLACWVLDGSSYRSEALGRENDEIRPSLFPGLVISLPQIFEE